MDKTKAVEVCSWCPDAEARTRAAVAAGCEVSHGACEECKEAFIREYERDRRRPEVPLWPSEVSAVLREFCGHDGQSVFSAPFRVGGWVYATDGRIMVRTAVIVNPVCEQREFPAVCDSAAAMFRREYEDRPRAPWCLVDLSVLDGIEVPDPGPIKWFRWGDWPLNVAYGVKLFDLFGGDVRFAREERGRVLKRGGVDCVRWFAGPFEGLLMAMASEAGDWGDTGIQLKEVFGS